MYRLLLILLLVFPFAVMSQNGLERVSKSEQQAMIAQINEAASSVKTMQCDFEQTKFMSLLDDKMVSKGVMRFKQEQNLRWEYTAPYRYIFIVAGAKVMIKSSQSTDEIDVRSSRLFQEIVGIMVNSVTGKCLSVGSDFNTTMYTAGKSGEWVAKLVPRKKELRQMFSVITLYFHPEAKMITKVEMEENSGDMTQILLKNVITNVGLDDSVFTID